MMNKGGLHKALQSAFPLRERMAMMLGLRFDRNYAALAAPAPLDVEYWNIIVQVNAEGWLDALARAAHETVPGNPDLARLILDGGLTSVPPAPKATILPRANDQALQRLVRLNNDFINIAQFRERLSALEGQTCRIEVDGSPPVAWGTGFLVGPDLVMTNHHVVQTIPRDRIVTCRFDYLTDAAGITVRAGTVVPSAPDWLVNSRPADPADVSLNDTDIPAPDNLDFALIRLSRPVGNEPRQGVEGPDNPPRGWMGIDPALTAKPDDDLLILQHPKGSPLKLGIGRLTTLHGDGLRWRHDVMTEDGSSGSPVLNGQLDLIGLHHGGDPNEFRTARFNQAVPMARIVGWLQDKIDPFWTKTP